MKERDGSSRYSSEDALEWVISSLRAIGAKPKDARVNNRGAPSRNEFVDNPKIRDGGRIFSILCEHIILAAAHGARVVENPAVILGIRENFLFHEAAEALENLVSEGLIRGSPPWRRIQVIPEVPEPEYRAGGGRGYAKRSFDGGAGTIARVCEVQPSSSADSSRPSSLDCEVSRRLDTGRFFPRRRAGRPSFRNSQNTKIRGLTCNTIFGLLRRRANTISGEIVVRGAALILGLDLQILPITAVHLLESLRDKGYLKNCDGWRSIILLADTINDNSPIL